MKKSILFIWLMIVFVFYGLNIGSISAQDTDSTSIMIFDKNDIHFDPNNPSKLDSGHVIARDNGRVISRTLNLPTYKLPVTIIAHLEIHPIPKDPLAVYDKWDRAGNIRLSSGDLPDIEIIKFVTAYGGFTEYDVDISHLSSLLQGETTISAFIDTWVSPAWKVDFSLSYIQEPEFNSPDWIMPVLYEESFNAQNIWENGIEVTVNIPEDLKRVVMNYFVSGHCTDGTDADEFVSKYNVIYVDDVVVYRYKPWRDDCKQFRTINPYTKRWSDGWWSSDYSRSGWCPGDIVRPLQLDLSDHLTPGDHTMRFVIENIRPKDDDGDFGYWRVSSHLVGWDNK